MNVLDLFNLVRCLAALVYLKCIFYFNFGMDGMLMNRL